MCRTSAGKPVWADGPARTWWAFVQVTAAFVATWHQPDERRSGL
jgi:hypothetical protein